MYRMALVALFVVTGFSHGESWLLERTVMTKHILKDGNATVQHSGSGTIVGNSRGCFFVLTCAHNFTDKGRIAHGKLSVVSSAGNEYPCTLVLADTDADMALLRVKSNARFANAVFAKSEDYRAGVKLIKCGYPATRRVVGRGKLLAIKAHIERGERKFPVAISDIQTSFGDSGCGVFRASDKRLVGMIYGGRGGESSMFRLDDLVRFLEAAAKKDSDFHFGKEDN